ncbi:MAG: hypothetical protein UW99_C0003G0027 [Candidatus Collierbacteria bacterium GW2011_GWC2_45_15]|uniref:Uncharacterized protein n=1 Tax=Candidatus Collierbacteria bacterium GW2011_GWC2_45_15 TaxID=1618394 RepID=A0A0G1LW55_9BACT|nr:MAG: hypothetical protein UW99_C0003G0027 [Candidatus Collierbacteria bacterium GW2011_GWC2_45_15]
MMKSGQIALVWLLIILTLVFWIRTVILDYLRGFWDSVIINTVCRSREKCYLIVEMLT